MFCLTASTENAKVCQQRLGFRDLQEEWVDEAFVDCDGLTIPSDDCQQFAPAISLDDNPNLWEIC